MQWLLSTQVRHLFAVIDSQERIDFAFKDDEVENYSKKGCSG